MSDTHEIFPRYIAGTRNLRTVVEDPRLFPLPTSQQKYNELRDQGFSDDQIFDLGRIHPKTDYSHGGGPITRYDYSGLVYERVVRIVPRAELNAAQKKFLQISGHREVAEVVRYDRLWRKTRHRVWVPVQRSRVEPLFLPT